MLYTFSSANGSAMSRQPIPIGKNVPPATVKVVRFGLICSGLLLRRQRVLIASHLAPVS